MIPSMSHVQILVYNENFIGIKEKKQPHLQIYLFLKMSLQNIFLNMEEMFHVSNVICLQFIFINSTFEYKGFFFNNFIIYVFLIVEFGLWYVWSQAVEFRLNSCGTRAQFLRSVWNLPRPRIDPVSPALAGGFFTTKPPGKPSISLFNRKVEILLESILYIQLVTIHTRQKASLFL